MLEAQEKVYDQLKKVGQVEVHLADAQDAFELSARVALGAWDARSHREVTTEWRGYKEDTQFEIGYKIACAELACVLRAMRKGHPPDIAEMRAATKIVLDAVLDERIPGEYEGLRAALKAADRDKDE